MNETKNINEKEYPVKLTGDEGRWKIYRATHIDDEIKELKERLKKLESLKIIYERILDLQLAEFNRATKNKKDFEAFIYLLLIITVTLLLLKYLLYFTIS